MNPRPSCRVAAILTRFTDRGTPADEFSFAAQIEVLTIAELRELGRGLLRLTRHSGDPRPKHHEYIAAVRRELAKFADGDR